MTLLTERLTITELSMDMAEAIHVNSLDEDNRRFVPDEVFETIDEARDTVSFLMSQYKEKNGPLVYAILVSRTDENIGYVQLAPLEGGMWEIGYHIAKAHTGKGYAAEAVRAFLPAIAEEIRIREIYGICLKENTASVRVMEKCNFTRVYDGIGDYQGQPHAIVKMLWQYKR